MSQGHFFDFCVGSGIVAPAAFCGAVGSASGHGVFEDTNDDVSYGALLRLHCKRVCHRYAMF